MSDTVAILNEGVIQQIGTPVDIYNEPKNAFVANFIGESNIIDGIMLNDYKVKFCNKIFTCVDSGFTQNENIDVVIRPEDLVITDENKGLLKGVIKSIIFKGVHYEMVVNAGNFEFMVHSTLKFPIGSTVGLTLTPEDIHIMKKTI